MQIKKLAALAAGALVVAGVGACASVEEPASTPEQGSSTKQVQVADKPTTTKAHKPSMTSGQRNALQSAEDYLDYQSFSKSGLLKQLKFEHFSGSDARWAVSHVKADWMQQAVKTAGDYLDGQSFSRQALIDQLKFDGFTQAQAEHGVSVAYH